MSFTTKDAEARMDALERQVGEIHQNQVVITMAITRLTRLVEDAAQAIEAPEASD